MTQADGRCRRPQVAPPAAPLIGHAADSCTECWGCVRHCPARALRLADGHTEVIGERCVKCGTCVTVCGNSAHQVRSDLDAVRELLASPTPVVALLASEHIAALHPRSPSRSEHELRALGFAGVETTVLGEEIIAAAYEQLHAAANGTWPRLRSTCPVTSDWVRRFYPQLTEALVPIAPPYVAQARLIRRLNPDDVAIVYVSPCWARKDEVHTADFAGEVDMAIGFDELRELLEHSPERPVQPSSPSKVRPVKQISVTDGFPRRTLRESNRTDRDVMTVRGLGELDKLLSAIVRGEVSPEVVDMLNCEGCIDGPCVNRDISVFAKRNIDLAERERLFPAAPDSRLLIAALPGVETKRVFEPEPAPVRQPNAEEIDRVLAAGEFESRDVLIDCGACGWDTCLEHAEAICLGNSTWEMCFPLAKKRLVRERESLAAAAVTDTLTGLFNRRAFDERLEDEVARSRRYGTPLSLVMLDLDGFKDVNDRHGHAAGDALLRAVGGLLGSELLRATDIPVRYGGDEFAFVLPSTTKTEAWLVAEKVRTALGALVAFSEDGQRLSASASAGVAALGEQNGDAQALLQAADAALYRAKRNGRDRVEIAAG